MVDTSPDSFLREIDEDMRQERYAKLWKKYGGVVIGAAVLLVVVVAGYQGWRAYDSSTRQEYGERYASADALAQRGNAQEAAQAFSRLAAEAGGGYETLARLREAALLAETGDKAGAVAAYFEIAADGDADEALRDTATVLGALHGLETLAPSEIRSRLEPLRAEGHAWRHSARELSALAAIKAGDTEAARGLLETLRDDEQAPPPVRQRATELLDSL